MPKVTEAHVEARRLQILQAACVCMARNGFQASTMQDICRAAGLSAGAVYGYFSSKEAILEALAEEGLRQNSAVFRGLERVADPGEALRQFCQLVLGHALRASERAGNADPARIKVGLWAEAVRNPQILDRFLGGYRMALDELAKIVRRAQRKRQLPRRLNPHAVAQSIVSLLEGLVLQQALDPDLDPGSYSEVIDLMLGRFCPSPEETQR